MTPQRIRLQRTKGWRKPEGAVVVARPTKWGNPFKVGGPIGGWLHPGCELWRDDHLIISVEHAVAMFRVYAGVHFVPVRPEAKPHQGIYTYGIQTLRAHAERNLRGKDLACWCPLEDEQGNRVPCHADVLLELANPGWTP